MNKIAAVLLLLGGLLVAQGCGNGTGQGAGTDQGIAIRGEVVATGELPGDSKGSLILVEGQKESDTQYDKASVKVPGKAKVYTMRDGKKAKAAPLDLKSGQRVEIKFVGPVAESYPVQAEAGEVVILDAGAGGQGK